MNKPLIKNSLYSQIATLLQAARQNVVRAVNQTMVYTYFEIGRMIVEDEQQGKERAEYGKQVLKELSIRLTAQFGKGFSKRNLEQMRQFFLTYSIAQKSSAQLQLIENEEIPIRPTIFAELQIIENNANEISETVSRKFILSWSHYLKLIRIENPDERSFYEIECAANNWSLKELQRQFDTALYERLALSRDKAGIMQLAEKGQIIEKPLDILKDPYILEFLDLPDKHQYSESELETEIIDKLEHFLLELGKGFTFVARQFRMTIDEKHYKADLVFFNRLLKCFVVIDLKIGELTHQDIGQMQMYVNYHDRVVKLPDENKTIGIVLCKDKSQTLVEFTLPENNDQIFASRYRTVLPDKQTFIQLLNQEEA
ncbi:MAG: PDDEXK nuclease domain-containing protein [Bacteroidota bacterium]|nr:PDDEXK nuclease domain-containing protein [Bacteroidota bacterium]